MTAVELNPQLKDLLMREAHLRLYRERLEPVWSRKEAALRAIESARPPRLLWLVSKRKRAEYEASLATARKTAAYLRGGMETLDRIEPHVKQLIRTHLHDCLRENDAAYARACEARELKEDWLRGLDRFAEATGELVRALDAMRQGARGGDVVELFRGAVEAAKKMMEAARATNRIAEEQTRRYVEAGLAVRPLPRLADTDHAAGLLRIRTLPAAEATAQLTQFAEQMAKLHASGIAALRAEAGGVDEAQEMEVHTVLLVAWEQLRASIAPEIFAGDTEKVVTETAEQVLALEG
jgi:hypothetical protein